MAWSIVGVGTVAETATTPLVLTEPAGVAAGDLLVACISGRGYTAGGAWCVLPTGWTPIASIGNANTATNTSALANGAMFYIVRGASAPALSWTLTGTASVAMGRIVAYRGGVTGPARLNPSADVHGSATSGTTYATVRTSTNATTVPGATTANIGQGLALGTYTCSQYFLTFNTSSIPTSQTVATLSLSAMSAGLGVDVLEVREVSSTANMISGDSLAALPLLGSASLLISVGGRILIPLDLTVMSRTSSTKLIVHSREQRTATAPASGDSGVQFSSMAAAAILNPFIDFVIDAGQAITLPTASTSLNVTTAITTNVVNDLIVLMCAGGQEATWSAISASNPSGGSGATDTTSAPSTTTWFERADSNTVTGADTSLGIFDAVQATVRDLGGYAGTASIGAGHVVISGAFRIAPPIEDAWANNDKTTNLTLTNSDKTASATAALNAVRSTTKHTNEVAGKYYVEFLATTTVSATLYGIKSTTSTPLTGAGSTINVEAASGEIRDNNTSIGNIGSALANGDILCMAWDSGAEKIWFRKNGGNWNNDASANPATGTNGVNVSLLASATDFALWYYSGGNTSTTIRTEFAEYTQAVPTGFMSWMNEIPLDDAWNAFDKSATITLSASDKTATLPVTGPFTGIRSTTTHPSGTAAKYYAEFLFTTVVGEGTCYVGLKNATDSVTVSSTGASCASDGNCYWQSATVANMSTAFANGDVACMAWDAGGEKIWFRKNSGNWNGNASDNPATGAGGIDMSAAANVAHSLWSYGQSDTAARVVTIRTEAAEFTQAIPTGFKSWMGESLDAWNNQDKSATITLSNSDKTASAPATGVSGVQTTARLMNGTAGKYYVECLFPSWTGGGFLGFGLHEAGRSPTDTTRDVIVNASGQIYVNAANSGINIGTHTSGDIISFAWDAGAELVWFRRNSGNWNNSGTADPAAGTGSINASTVSSILQVLYWFTNPVATATATIRMSAADMTLLAPAGFNSWLGETLFTPNATVNVTGIALAISVGDETVVIPTPDAWSSYDKEQYVILSNADKTFTTSSTNGGTVRSSTLHTFGKYYAEIAHGTFVVNQLGISPRSNELYVGNLCVLIMDTGDVYANNVYIAGVSLGQFYANDVLCIAWDATLKRIWLRKNAGNWNNNASYSPAAGTGYIDCSGFSATETHGLLGRVNAGLSGRSATIRTEAAEYTVASIPAGFQSWMGEALVSVSVNATGIALAATAGTVSVVVRATVNATGLQMGVGTAGLGGPQTALTTETPAALSNFATEMGGKMRFTKAGRITAIRYWRDPSATAGARGIYVWNLSGGVLVNGGGPNDTGMTGWVTCPISWDVDVNDEVVVSVNNPNVYGYINPFTYPVTNGDVILLEGRNSATGINAFPSTSNNATCVFVDCVFQAFSAEEVVTGKANINAATNLATITAGTVTVAITGPIFVNAATNLATMTAGTVTASIKSPVNAATNLATMATFTPTVIGKSNYTATNNLANMTAGNASVNFAFQQNAATNLATITAGTVTVTAIVRVDVSTTAATNLATMTAGTATVNAKANTTALTNLTTMTAGTPSVVGKGNISALSNLGTMTAGTVSVLTGGVPWTPAALGANLIAWYDFADTSTVVQSGGFLTQWTDKSGNSRHGIAGAASLAINSDGVYIANAVATPNSVIQMPTLPSQWFDMAFAGKPNAAGSYRTLMANKAGSYHHILLETANDKLGTYASAGGFFQAGTLTWTPVDGQIYYSGPDQSNIKIGRDGAALLDETGEVFTPDPDPALMNFGTSGTQGFGTAREFVFMVAGQTQDVRDKVSGYLAWKWDGILGVTTHVAALPAGHPYKGVAPSIGGAVNVTPTGIALTATAGTVTLGLGIGVSATSQFALMSPGDVLVRAGIGVSAATNLATMTAGNPTVTGKVNLTATSYLLSMGTSTPTVTGKANVTAATNLATMGLGDETVRSAMQVYVASVPGMTMTAGTVTTLNSITVLVTGLQMTCSIGGNAYIPQIDANYQREGMMLAMSNMMGN